MKRLIALWVFLLFISVSYGEEYKCLNERGENQGDFGKETCIYFESKAKYDTTHLHCKDGSLEDIFRAYNETIISESKEGFYSDGRDLVYIGDKLLYNKGGIFFEQKGRYEEDKYAKYTEQEYIADLRNPTELGKVLIKREIERIKDMVKERDEFLKLLLDNNLCKIVEF